MNPSFKWRTLITWREPAGLKAEGNAVSETDERMEYYNTSWKIGGNCGGGRVRLVAIHDFFIP